MAEDYASAKIMRLQAEVASLKATVASLDGVVDIKALAADSSKSRFKPLPSTNCFGVKPCLHSTASGRVTAGCLEAVWDGTYGGKAVYKHVNVGNLSFEQPVPPVDLVPFVPSIGDQCDLADLWKVSVLHKGHVTEATEAHWHQRLRGVKNTLWLSIGSSIDHGWIKEVCAGFGAMRTTTDAAPPTKAYPLPGLLVDYCHVRALNMTFAHINGGGIVTTETSRDPSLQPTRFAEINDQMRKAGLTTPPTFLSFGGMEWDFKNWRCNYPNTRSEWKLPVALLQMQATAARKAWPSIRVVFSRTMFQPTYGTFGCPCCANENHFWHYNHLLRATPPITEGGSGGDAVCDSIHALDMQRMTLCNNSVGSCSSRTGWTIDGLHPTKAVYLQYVSNTLNTAADLGERCRDFGAERVQRRQAPHRLLQSQTLRASLEIGIGTLDVANVSSSATAPVA